MADLKTRILRYSRNKSAAWVAARLGCKVSYVHETRSKHKRAAYYRELDRSNGERRRREAGVPSRAKYRAAHKKQREARAKRIAPLLRKGLSWRKAAARLGISHNVIAGLAFRNRDLLGAK